MAHWDKINERTTIDDRRSSPATVVGGLSLTGVVLILAFNFLAGGTAEDALSQIQDIQMSQPQTQTTNSKEFEGNDSYENFMSTILGSMNSTWSQTFSTMGQVYTPPTLVLFRGGTQSACGGASSVSGPHYCPLDQTIYLDETFFEELKSRFGAKGGDVAEAYVVAHEVGHHIQNELGIMDQINKVKNRYGNDANELSIKLELQADCFAGLWAGTLKDKGVLEKGEIEEAIDAAEAVGDDHIQETTQGSIHPESFTHGTSVERATWFSLGYDTGLLDTCNTFKK